ANHELKNSLICINIFDTTLFHFPLSALEVSADLKSIPKLSCGQNDGFANLESYTELVFFAIHLLYWKMIPSLKKMHPLYHSLKTVS
ncbi:hypothetical protein ABFV55_27550, partial [Pseudomonas syringae]|uniref:hypothetical protein n=1 Tax=Pseudomonas syringae TaxID=317 RepID=UPI0034D96742